MSADDRTADVVAMACDVIPGDSTRQSESLPNEKTCQGVSSTNVATPVDIDELMEDFDDLDIYSHPSMIESHHRGSVKPETRMCVSLREGDIGSRRRHGVGLDASTNDKTLCRQADLSATWWQNEDGDTQLHLAIIERDWRQAEMMSIVAPPSVLDLQNDMRQTPLHLAVIVDRPELVSLMLQRGACATLQDAKGNTPLHVACQRGLRDCIAAMTSSTALPRSIVDVMNFDGETVVHAAAAAGHVDILRHLIQPPLAANVNARDGRSGRTVLHHAVESRNMPVLTMLLVNRYIYSVCLDAVTYDDLTPLALAEGRGYGDVAELLVLAGADSACGWDPNFDFDDTDSMGSCSSDDEDLAFDDFCIRGRPIDCASWTSSVARNGGPRTNCDSRTSSR